MKRRRGFALIELPLVLFIFAVVGALLAPFFKGLTGTGPPLWYWCILGVLGFPFVLIMVTLVVGAIMEHWRTVPPQE